MLQTKPEGPEKNQQLLTMTTLHLDVHKLIVDLSNFNNNNNRQERKKPSLQLQNCLSNRVRSMTVVTGSSFNVFVFNLAIYKAEF